MPHGHDHPGGHARLAASSYRTACVGCKHTDAAQALIGSPAGVAMPRYRTDHPYVGATLTRWAPLRAFVPRDGWGIQEARITVSDEPYHLALVQATGTTGATATAAIVFAACHPATLGPRAAPVGDWGGYTPVCSQRFYAECMLRPPPEP